MNLKGLDLSKLARRYGPVAAVALVIVLVFVLIPGDDRTPVRAVGRGPQAEDAAAPAAGEEVAPAADAPAAPGAARTARKTGPRKSATLSGKAGGGGGPEGFVRNSPVAACGKNNRLDVGYAYAPPCATAFTGQNGGNSWKGVTGDKIKIAVYLAWHTDPQTAATVRAAGGCATNDCQWDFTRAYVRWFEKRYQTWGRKVELVKITASGPGGEDAIAHADARQVIDAGVFAVFGGTASTAFADDLKEAKIMCFCTVSLPQELYENWDGYVWSTLHASTQAYLHRAEYVGKRLAGQGRKAIYAGDAVFKTQQRKFGFVYYDTARGDYTLGAKFFIRHLRERYGVDIPQERITDYSGATLGDAQVHAPRIVAQMQAQGVTSLIFAGDPIQPVALTRAAKNANYHPEWIITGSALTDTDTLGRLYDQEEWKNAFGISLLSVPLPNPKTFWYRAYRAEQDTSAPAPDAAWRRDQVEWPTIDAALYLAPATNFFTGLHMGGAVLTPPAFKAGMFAYPVTGGTVTVPRVSWGPKTVAGYKFVDYTSFDDTMEIWWDPNVPASQAADNRAGAYQRVAGGKRYDFGEWPSTDPKPFQKGHGEVTKYDDPPDQ